MPSNGTEEHSNAPEIRVMLILISNANAKTILFILFCLFIVIYYYLYHAVIKAVDLAVISRYFVVHFSENEPVEKVQN